MLDAKAKAMGISKSEMIERIARESILTLGVSLTGGMLGQLIGDYRDQLAAKEEEIKNLDNEIQRLNSEAQKIKSRIQEFESLQSQLEKQSKENI